MDVRSKIHSDESHLLPHRQFHLVLSPNDIPTISEVSSELASTTRCSILISLANKPAKLSSLARELNITAQEAFRNINRLTEASLVKKWGDADITRNSGGAFHLTELGRLLVKEIPYLIVIKKHQEYLMEHTFRDVPDKFVQRIGILKNCETTRNVTAVFEKLKKLESGAENYLKVMVSQGWPDEGKILVERATNNVDVCAIFGRNTVFPKEVFESVIPAINELQKRDKIRSKMIDNVNIALYVTDSQSALMLPNMKGEVDMNILLHGQDPAFNEWCHELFNYYWERAGPPDLNKASVI